MLGVEMHIITLILGRWRQVDPWCSLASQFSLVSVSQANQSLQGGQHLRNGSRNCPLAPASVCTYVA